MKYRIVKSIFVGTPRYHIEKHGLFGWSEITELKVCTDGVAWNEAIYFNTPEEAEEYIKNKTSNPQTIVKELSESKNKSDIDISEVIIMIGISILIASYGIAILIAAIKY